MSIYEKFFTETINENGALSDIKVNFPDNFNFANDVVDVIAKDTPKKTALCWCNALGEEHIFSFEDIRALSCKAANVFHNAGIRRGDRVLVVLKRHYEYWYTAIALHRIGAVMIPATHMLTVDDFVYRLKASDAKAVICTVQDEVPEKVKNALSALNKECLLWCVQENCNGFENLSESIKTQSDIFERCQTKATDDTFLYFTWGTTGYPKGVIHDFSYPLAHAVTAKYWQNATDGGLHFTVAETGWAKASWGKLYGQWLVGSAVMVFDFDSFYITFIFS